MPETALHEDMLVAEAMRRRPSAVEAFVRLRMACPGCALAPFITLGEAARAYGLGVEELLAHLEAAGEVEA